MDALARDLGDDLGEMEDLHGDLAGTGDLGVEGVIGEIGPARDAQMQSGLAVRPRQPDQANGAINTPSPLAAARRSAATPCWPAANKVVPCAGEDPSNPLAAINLILGLKNTARSARGA